MDIVRDKFKEHQTGHEILASKILRHKGSDMMAVKPQKKIALPIGRTAGHADSPVCRSPLTPFPGSPFGFSAAPGFTGHLNAEALGRSLSCPSTPLFSPLLGTWADDTEKYFPEFQYPGSAPSGLTPMNIQHMSQHLEDDFPDTPLTPAADSYPCYYEGSSPLGPPAAEDDDDDALSNHSFFSNPHSIGKAHQQTHKDVELKDDSQMEPQPYLALPEDRVHIMDRTWAKNDRVVVDAKAPGSPVRMPQTKQPEAASYDSLPPPMLLIQGDDQSCSKAAEPFPLSQGSQNQQQADPSSMQPFPSISSSLQDLDQENFAAAFAQTFHSDVSPSNSFGIQHKPSNTDMLVASFDNIPKEHCNAQLAPSAAIPMHQSDVGLDHDHLHPYSQQRMGSANNSFSRPVHISTPPGFPSPQRISRHSSGNSSGALSMTPPVAQPLCQMVPPDGPGLHLGPALFPKPASAPQGSMRPSMEGNAQSYVAQDPSVQPFVPSTGMPPFGGLTKSGATSFPSNANSPSLPPFATPPSSHPRPNLAGPASQPTPYSTSQTQIAVQQNHATSPIPSNPANTSSIAHTLNQAMKLVAHHNSSKTSAGGSPTPADRSKSPPFMSLSSGPGPTFMIPTAAAPKFLPEGTQMVCVGNPPFLPGPNGNLAIYVTGTGPALPGQTNMQPMVSNQTLGSVFHSSSNSSAAQIRVPSAQMALPSGSEHLFSAPAPPHPSVSPSMSPAMVGPGTMVTLMQQAPMTSQTVTSVSQAGRQGRTGRNGPGRHFMNEYEMQLTETTVFYLQDESINPYRGSVPVERIQNVVRSKHADLYNTVVGTRHNSWRRYVERHPDVFHLFSVEDGKWRMRLVQHDNWEEGDRQEQAERQSKEQHLIACLSLFLEQRQGLSCKVDEFMDAYPTLPLNQGMLTEDDGLHPLPARGDLVRFVRRHSSHFIYDPDTLSMGLKRDAR